MKQNFEVPNEMLSETKISEYYNIYKTHLIKTNDPLITGKLEFYKDYLDNPFRNIVDSPNMRNGVLHLEDWGNKILEIISTEDGTQTVISKIPFKEGKLVVSNVFDDGHEVVKVVPLKIGYELTLKLNKDTKPFEKGNDIYCIGKK